jgi:hypothetical protein
MNDSEMIAVADQVLQGEDRESAAELALEVHRAMFKQIAETYARHLLAEPSKRKAFEQETR